MGELQTVLKYEIEATGAKESDAPLPSIIPETSGDSTASASGAAPTLKLMKSPQGEGEKQSETQSSSWGSSFSAPTVQEPPTKQVKLYQYVFRLQYRRLHHRTFFLTRYLATPDSSHTPSIYTGRVPHIKTFSRNCSNSTIVDPPLSL
jgi:hypothetical protein